MKAFEEWRLKNCNDNCDIGVDSGPGHRCTGLGTKKDAWRAALEWLLKSKGRGKLYDCDGDEYDIILVSTIEKELGITSLSKPKSTPPPDQS